LDNDWILPDPERLVSGKQCVIQYKDGRYYLTDNSTNGVELVKAGIRLRKGNSEPLQDGEVIRIGDYEIQARIDFSLPVTDGNPFADSSNSFEALMGRQGSVVTCTFSGRIGHGHDAGPVRLSDTDQRPTGHPARPCPGRAA
jgi:type VI secretion system protein